MKQDSPLYSPFQNNIAKTLNMGSLLILFTSLVGAIILFFSLVKKQKRANAAKLPPGPKKLPIIGNLHQLGKLPHRTLHNLSSKHGDLMLLQLGSVPTLVVSSADIAREIIKSHDLAFSGRPAMYAAKKLSYGFNSITFAPYGEYWRDMRKIVVLELMTAKRVQSFGNVRTQQVALLLDKIACATNPVALSALVFSLSNNVVSQVTFGSSSSLIEGKQGKFQEILGETQHLAAEINVADYFPRMAWINKFNGVDKRSNNSFRSLDKLLDEILEEHKDPERAKPDNEDITDVLLEAQKNPNSAVPLTNQQIKGVLSDIFIAGTDTSAATIIWTMSELMRNPRVMQKAQEEVRKMAQGQLKIEEADLSRLTYLKLVIKESFRVHPAAPLMVPRETTENCLVADKYEIPARTRVLFNATAIHMDPKYWEDPEKFWPERFLDKEIDFRGKNFEFLPFGAGRRGCPGINFAIPLVELTLANLLLRFNWKLPEGMSPEDVDMEEALGITMHKKVPLNLVASPVHSHV